jgi:hypothetical protein
MSNLSVLPQILYFFKKNYTPIPPPHSGTRLSRSCAHILYLNKIIFIPRPPPYSRTRLSRSCAHILYLNKIIFIPRPPPHSGTRLSRSCGGQLAGGYEGTWNTVSSACVREHTSACVRAAGRWL